MRANSVLDTKPKEHNLKQIAVNGSQRKIEQPCILTPNQAKTLVAPGFEGTVNKIVKQTQIQEKQEQIKTPTKNLKLNQQTKQTTIQSVTESKDDGSMQRSGFDTVNTSPIRNGKGIELITDLLSGQQEEVDFIP